MSALHFFDITQVSCRPPVTSVRMFGMGRTSRFSPIVSIRYCCKYTSWSELFSWFSNALNCFYHCWKKFLICHTLQQISNIVIIQPCLKAKMAKSFYIHESFHQLQICMFTSVSSLNWYSNIIISNKMWIFGATILVYFTFRCWDLTWERWLPQTQNNINYSC